MKTLYIPKHFYQVKYVGARIPGVKNQSDLSLGANCQVFAYELLKANHLIPENLRSSELWRDIRYSRRVQQFKALDLMLYNNKASAFGAHMGVYLGEGRVFHLSQDIGYPEIALHSHLQQRPKYTIYIGAKRIQRISPASYTSPLT